MKLFKSIILCGMGAMALTLTSCNDWLDVNTNPNTPTAEGAKYEQRLAHIQFYTNDAYMFASWRNSMACGDWTRNAGGGTYFNMSVWYPTASIVTTPYQWWFVGACSNVPDLIDKAHAAGNKQFEGAGYLIKAYGHMLMTDLYGEMPYTDAVGSNALPVYDNGKTIFMGCMADIDKAIELLEEGKSQSVELPALSQNDSWNQGDVDKWMNNVREVLEAGESGQMGLIREMNMNLYEKEVFVFTPKGDLFKLPQGATILVFAFHIHSKVGCTCTGAKVNGKNQKLNYKVKSGDTIEILTASTQTPRQDWLNIVVTSKARNKIKQAVNEEKMKKADFAREMLSRRFKNRKIDSDEATISKLVTKLGYKSIIDFYCEIAQGNIDVNDIIEKYIEFTKPVEQPVAHETADKFVLQQRSQPNEKSDSDILIIDNNVKGINYKFSKCCNPIYGDKITGFIASDGAIKIHRADCGNVKNLKEKYPYRIIQSQWSGKIGNQFAATLKVVGQDDIGIVTNITSLINKEGDAILRNISINSNGELFEGILVIGISSTEHLAMLMNKIKKLKGVKDVMRTAH